jgi:hypothetical protein
MEGTQRARDDSEPAWTPGERRPVPDTAMARLMAAGHLARTGHPLRAELVATGEAGIWRTERACCQ